MGTTTTAPTMHVSPLSFPSTDPVPETLPISSHLTALATLHRAAGHSRATLCDFRSRAVRLVSLGGCTGTEGLGGGLGGERGRLAALCYWRRSVIGKGDGNCALAEVRVGWEAGEPAYLVDRWKVNLLGRERNNYSGVSVRVLGANYDLASRPFCLQSRFSCLETIERAHDGMHLCLLYCTQTCLFI